MTILEQVTQKVNSVFNHSFLDSLALKTGFIKRHRKINAKTFLEQMLLFKLESPKSSLEDLAHAFSEHDCKITKQALHKKFSPSAVSFVQAVLDSLLNHVFKANTIVLSAIPFIHKINVIDSSELRLNTKQQEFFPQAKKQGAAVKLQAMVDVLNNDILLLDIRPSKEPDQGYKAHMECIAPNDLWIADLGYFCIKSFQWIEQKKGYYLSRYFKNTHVYDPDTNELINLRTLLDHTRKKAVELNIHLGELKLNCRLIALKLPGKAYLNRLKNLGEKQRRDKRTIINKDDPLNQWTILVTNLPDSVNAPTLLMLYRYRWQIEIFFKTVKTFFNVRKTNETHQQHAMLSLYISLIAIVLLSLMTMTITDKEISLYKASKLFIKNIRKFIEYLSHKKKCVFYGLINLITQWAVKESRRNRPSTRLLLT